MTKRGILFFLAICAMTTKARAAPECICNCNCREDDRQCPDNDYTPVCEDECPKISRFSFHNPEHSLTLGFSMLEGRDPGKIVIKRTEPLFLRYEHRFAPWLYLYVTFKTELTDLTYYSHLETGSTVGNQPLQLDLQAGLKSKWNRIGGAGMRFIPYQGNRLRFNLSLGFEEMALSEVKIEHLYFMSPLLSLELANMAEGHARIRYNWRRLDFEPRLDWNLPWLDERFTLQVNVGAMLVKSDLEIWYDERIAERINDAGSRIGITPRIPNHEEFYVFAPSVGAGVEFRLANHIAIDIAGSTLPFGKQNVYTGTFGLTLKY